MASHLHVRKSGRFVIFCDWESNANLTPGSSFGHNLCFKYSNGSCEPILYIYVPRYFQWYKEIIEIQWVWSLQSLFENLEVHQDSNSQSGSSLGSVEVHFLTLSYTPMSMKCDFRASLLARTFASPCLGHEPMVKIVTLYFCTFQ